MDKDIKKIKKNPWPKKARRRDLPHYFKYAENGRWYVMDRTALGGFQVTAALSTAGLST